MAIGRPCILVPLPHALDNDQLENATRLQDGGGGWCIRQSELTPERLAAELERLFSAPEILAEAAAKAKAMAPTDAVKKLVDSVVNFQEKSRTIINEMRVASTKNSAEIRDAVEDGKRRLATLAAEGNALLLETKN